MSEGTFYKGEPGLDGDSPLVGGIYEDDVVYDVDAVVEALRVAWKMMPEENLSHALRVITQGEEDYLGPEELLETINEFILQNN